VQEWFHAAGLLVLEGYGLTERASVCVNNPRARASVPLGRRSWNSSEDRGRRRDLDQGSRRHARLPQRSGGHAEALNDGWFATGDIGELDEKGYLRITDRKKDLIKTSPVASTSRRRRSRGSEGSCPYVSQVLVHGEGRKYATALITLDPEAIEGWAKEEGLSYSSVAELARSQEVHD
jgi:long-chain acyl-CoA synthetase